MNVVQPKTLPWSMFVGVIYYKLLEELFCSSTWLKACVCKSITEEGTVAQIDVSCYPPGGYHQTTMLHCQECHRWAPRDGFARYTLGDNHIENLHCLDCVTEADAYVFTEHLKTVSDKALERQLKRLYWKTASICELVEHADKEYSDIWEAYNADSGDIESCHWRGEADYWRAFRDHEDWVGKDTSLSEQMDDVLEEITSEHQRKFSRRSLGCQGVLLDESEESLQDEIDYYCKNNRVLPSTQRGNRINPFQVKKDYLESAVPYSNDEFGFWDLD